MSPVYSYVINLVLVLILVFCNAFFVVSEFAIVKIRKTKLEELAHSGSKRAKIALKISEQLNISRNGVYDCLKKGIKQLENYEKVLKLHEKEQKISDFFNEIKKENQEQISLIEEIERNVK